jgi:23S rRNA pseudouridine2457 synthase
VLCAKFDKAGLIQKAGFETGMSIRAIAFHKPYGVLPCFTDSEGRPTLADYITVPRVYAAGRLDQDSEGLMVLTSDGGLAHRITDPQHKLPKVYLVQVERIPDTRAITQLCQGVVLGGKRTRPAQVRLLDTEPPLPERPVPIRFRKNVPTAWLEIAIHEGLNRQVRRMTAAVGHPTLRLVRIAIGPIRLGDLNLGEWRALEEDEIKSINQLSNL